MMIFISGIIIVCFLALANGSLFDITRIVDNEDGKVRIRIGNSSADFIQEIWLSYKKFTNEPASFEDCSTSKELCQTYSDGTHITITSRTDECILLHYSTRSSIGYSLKASFDLDKTHMYGGPTNERNGDLNWPAEESFFVQEPYMKIKPGDENGLEYQAILEPYWLFSKGFYIYVDNFVPLFITSNSSKMFELKAENVSPYKKSSKLLALNFALCKFANTRQAHEHAIKHFLGKPSKLPDTRAVSQPVWTTSVPQHFHTSVNQAAITDFAEKIVEFGCGGRFVIGHKWEKYYGSFQPNSSRIPDFQELLGHLKSLNFTLDLRVHPFVSYRVKLTNQRYLAKDETFDKFYQDYGKYINATNPNALNWFYQRLLNLRQKYAIDSFEFHNGDYEGLTDSKSNQVDTIIRQSAALLARFNSTLVTNMARGTQKYNFFLAIPSVTDAHSHWRALRAVIPRLLQMNILGYSFTLSNIVGGNHKDISREQYLRWVQLSVFMPTMQFSIYRPPWSYDEEIIKLTKKFVDMHAKYSSYIIELMNENIKTGAPVNPPIWWLSPNDSTALACKAVMYDSTTQDLPGRSVCRSEFLLGEKILVAPVVVEGQTKRDIYLPIGFWQDGNSEKTFNGPTWVKDYPAELDTLPYFIRLHPKPSTNSTTDEKNRQQPSTSGFNLSYIWVIVGIFLVSGILMAAITPQFTKSMYIKYKTFK